jgi:catechol-2,3-dioxygenase
MCESTTVLHDNNQGQLSIVKTEGLHHLGLTVFDVVKTANFFTQQLQFDIVGERPAYPAIFISDGHIMLTLWQVKVPEQAVSFSRHNNIGLHHFALAVVNKEALYRLHLQLKNLPEVEIEFAPEVLGATVAEHMMCLIPGGLRVEFIARS